MTTAHDIATVFDKGLRLSIKAKPNAKPKAGGKRGLRVVEIGDGRFALEVPVAAVAEDGKANEAVLTMIAVTLGVRSAAVSIKTGHTNRLKIVEVLGDSAELMARLQGAVKKT